MTVIYQRDLRDACGAFGTGVTIVTTHVDGHDHGMTANAFMSISLDPPLIAVSIAEKARMLAKIERSGRFAVSVLAAGMEDLAWHFAGKPMSGAVECFERCHGLPVIRGAMATFVADVADQILAGDHMIFVGRVAGLMHDADKKPLLFFRGRFGGLADPHPAPALSDNFSDELIW